MSSNSGECPQFPKCRQLHGGLGTHTRSARATSRVSVTGKSERLGFSRVGTATGALALAFVGSAAPALADAPSSDKGGSSRESSWAGLSSPDLVDTGEFAESAGAASRAKMRTPVVENGCVPLAGAADGSRTLTYQQRFYQPLAQGTFSTSSGYGYRVHPTTGQYSFHEGDDYRASAGTPIHAVADGVVVSVGYEGTAGLRTVIRHTDTDGSMVESRYLHQLPGSPTVYAGQEVSAGQVIGAVGNTGRSTGPHLHLEIRPGGGGPVNPGVWLATHEAIYVGQECS